MEVLGTLSDLFGVAGALFALAAWVQSRRLRDDIRREQARQEQPIQIRLRLQGEANRSIVLPITLKRRELTRAELLGRLGMIPMREPGKRFSLVHLSTPEFLAQIGEAQDATSAYIITIPCTSTEFEQFAIMAGESGEEDEGV